MRSIRRHEWTQQRHQALKSIKCNRGVTNHKDNITKDSVLGFNLFDENKSWECTAKIELCQKKEFWHMNALKSKKRGNIMCVFVCFSSWAEQTKTFFVCEWNECRSWLFRQKTNEKWNQFHRDGGGVGSSFYEERTKNETDKDHYFPCNASEWVANTHTFPLHICLYGYKDALGLSSVPPLVCKLTNSPS